MKANKSLASEYGIQHKNISKNPSQGIGLNPNLNIEDEYIENLLKQVHFLNMQIKLIKEKQGQNKGLGIMGLLNKDQNPVVQHAITSNNKFSQMKNNLSQKVNSAQVEYLRLDDENFAVKAQRDFTERLSLKEQQNNIENKLYVDKQLTETIDNFKDQERKLQELRDQNNRVNKIHDKIERQWQELSLKDRTKQLLITIINNLQGETQQLNQKHFKANFESLQYHQKKLDEADALFRADDNYKQLVVQNGQLKDKLKRSDKELFEINYRVKEMQQMKKLSIRNKDVESELKKQAIDEVQRLKKRLTQKKNQFQNKFQEMKAGLDSNDDVRLLRGKLFRKDKEILDLRKKTQISQNNYKRLRDEVLKLQTNLIEIKERNKQKQEQIPVISAILNEVEVQLREAELDFEKNQAQLRTNENNLIESKNRLENYEEQLAYLEAKQQFFKKEVDVDEGIKKVRIDQLTTLMHNNSGLNNTITDLMGKWQQIIKFTRQPPN